MRSKAKAAAAVAASGLQTTVFAPSIVYTPGDPWLSLLERLSLLPGAAGVRGRPRGLPADLGRGRGRLRDRRAGAPGGRRPPRVRPGRARSRCPTTTSCARRCAPWAARGRWCTCRCRSCGRCCSGGERVMGPAAPATWEEAKLMEESMTTARGTADAEALGVNPLQDERGAGLGLGRPAARRRPRRRPSGWSARSAGSGWAAGARPGAPAAPRCPRPRPGPRARRCRRPRSRRRAPARAPRSRAPRSGGPCRPRRPGPGAPSR